MNMLKNIGRITGFKSNKQTFTMEKCNNALDTTRSYSVRFGVFLIAIGMPSLQVSFHPILDVA
jgi:hypothetical protein